VRANASAAKEMVEKEIADNKVMIFSKSHCPYCTKAKSAVSSLLPPTKFKVLEIENLKECQEIQDILMGITGGRSVPRVFVGGKFIGGGDDTAAKLKSGELKQLFEAVGVL
jgi:glutaredoxin 3